MQWLIIFIILLFYKTRSTQDNSLLKLITEVQLWLELLGEEIILMVMLMVLVHEGHEEHSSTVPSWGDQTCLDGQDLVSFRSYGMKTTVII